jgi:hypothetical protein
MLSISWLFYHIVCLVEILLIFQPFHFRSTTTFRPGAPIAYFIFSLVCNLIIYLPIVGMVGTWINIGQFEPGFLIVTIFGLFFGGIFRSVTDNSIVLLSFDGFKMEFVTYGFYEKKIEQIPIDEIEGLTMIETSTYAYPNFKICLVLDDGRLILLYLTIFKKKAERKLNELTNLLRLKSLQNPGGDPINDMNYGSKRGF